MSIYCTYNFGEKSTDDVGIALALLRLRQDGQLCSLFGISSLFLSLFAVITLVVCSLEVLVDVGERGGAQVVVGHGLNEAFNETPTY